MTVTDPCFLQVPWIWKGQILRIALYAMHVGGNSATVVRSTAMEDGVLSVCKMGEAEDTIEYPWSLYHKTSWTQVLCPFIQRSLQCRPRQGHYLLTTSASMKTNIFACGDMRDWRRNLGPSKAFQFEFPTKCQSLSTQRRQWQAIVHHFMQYALPGHVYANAQRVILETTSLNVACR
jgi:hypothetical protein